MGEQNRRAVEVEPPPGDKAAPHPDDRHLATDLGPEPGAAKSVSIAQDERQTERQAPPSATPGEGGEADSIG
jgi:hypothetical protein